MVGVSDILLSNKPGAGMLGVCQRRADEQIERERGGYLPLKAWGLRMDGWIPQKHGWHHTR